MPVEKRKKDLETTVGMEPTQHDIGPEADMLGAVDLGVPRLKTKGWKYALHGFFQAPRRLGIGPRGDLQSGTQWHSPAHIPGLDVTDWRYIGLTPTPGGSLYLNIANPNVSANVIITTDTLNDSSYDNLVKIGGVAQAYVTLKWADLFGNARRHRLDDRRVLEPLRRRRSRSRRAPVTTGRTSSVARTSPARR